MKRILTLLSMATTCLWAEPYLDEDGTSYEDEAFWGFSEADHLYYKSIKPEELKELTALHETFYIGSLAKSHCFYVVKEGRLKESIFVNESDALVGKYWVSREKINMDVIHERDLSSVFSCYKFRRVRDVDLDDFMVHTLDDSSYNNQNGANKTVDTTRVSARQNSNTPDTLNPNPTSEL